MTNPEAPNPENAMKWMNLNDLFTKHKDLLMECEGLSLKFELKQRACNGGYIDYGGGTPDQRLGGGGLYWASVGVHWAPS